MAFIPHDYFLYRMRIHIICIALIFILLIYWCLPTVSGQTLTARNTRLTTSNGLPSNLIRGVAQDRAGFLWMATHDGLARYDGRTFKVFRNRLGDSTSLAGNKVSDLILAPDGSLVINTEAGTVQRFDPTTERFTTLLDRRFLDKNKATIEHIQLSADGHHLWGLLPGVRLIHYDIRRKTLRTHAVPPLTGGKYDLPDFVLAPSGYIYGRTSGGLLQFDTRTGHKRIIPFPVTPPNRPQDMGYSSINRHQVALGPNGQIVVFGYDVLMLYDPVRDRFRTVPIPDAVKGGTGSNARKYATTVTYMLKRMDTNELFFGYMNRLYRLDGQDRLTLVRQWENVNSQLTPWFIDRSGMLWVGDELNGLTKLDLHPLPFSFRPKRKSFSEDLLEQDLGVALPDSFEVWDTEQWPRYTIDRTGTGYLLDPSRVYRHSPDSHTLTEVTKFRSLDNQVCCKLCLKTSSWRSSSSRAGEASTIWVYNNHLGLLAVGPDATKGKLYPNSILPPTHANADFEAGDIQPMGGSVWVGSQFGLGLFRYDIARQRYDAPLRNNPKSANSLPVNSINCLSADPVDSTVLWIGTEGGGLCRLDTRTMTFRRLGEAEGFPNGMILSIEADKQGRLWCAIGQGLVRVNQPVGPSQPLTWRYFTADDGLPESILLQTSSARLPDGRLVFGMFDGRVIFDPATIEDKHYEPPIVLTSLLINNKPVEAGSSEGQATLTATINALSELVLDYTQNFLTIGFAGLDFGKAEKLNYRYQLTGVDDDWVTVGTQNTANYTQLAPGHYIFRVNSTTADGRWSHQVKQLVLVIRPPFWATWWAYLTYVLAFGGLVLGFIRFRVRQLQQRQQMHLKQQEAEQLRAVDEVKTRFFSNITHEFRTPLTLILSPAEKLLQEPKLDVPTRQTIGSMHRNAGQLLGLINQLLDLSKLESRNMGVSLVRGDAVAFIQRLVEGVEPMAATRGIALEVKMNALPDSLVNEPWLFDADKWTKIITNLLSNALKFTPAGGQVSVTVEQPQFIEATPSQLQLQVADSGIGIPAQHLDHIFDRFFQVDDSRTRAYEGTGIGLALVKELIDLLGGTICVQSRTEPPTGTTFTLTLPIRSATEEPGAPVLNLHGQLDGLGPVAIQPDGELTPQPSAALPDDAPLVLVVDDNEELRTFIAGELAYRFRILTAADGQEGWDICQRELPDVVVTDVMMPQLDGYQLTQHIKTTLATNHIAVVLLTAKAAQQSRIAGLEQGADDYLTKPFHVNELVLRLTNLLTHQANLRANLHRQLSATASVAEEPATDPFINQLRQVIESRLDDSSLGVDDLANAIGMSRRTLYRKLTATANLSATDFVRLYRLQRAAQFLQDGHPIAEAAYRVGFESPAYFSKVFKQTYQQTPSEFQGR